jgi:hypothetical protein
LEDFTAKTHLPAGRQGDRKRIFLFVIQSCLHAEVQRFGTQA